MVSKRHILLCLAILSFVSATYADQEISASAYRDRLEGMWVGQLLGNYAGRQVEGMTTVYYEGPTYIPEGIPITDYQVQWNTILQGQYYSSVDSDGDGYADILGKTIYWQGDDDTCLEFLYAHSLQNQSALNVAERTSLWTNNLSISGLYIANRQAWYQINDHEKTAVESGSVRYNMNAGWAIDSQITTETLGALAVGMRQQGANLAGDFGGITNSGYSLHAAQFYAAMYADAPFTSDDVEILVDRGLQVVPTGSWTREIITKVQQLYTADKTDDGLLNNWLDSRDEIIAFAHQRGRDRLWVESASNTGLTTLAILYGQGSFKDTAEFGVRGGEDSDCNPATAGGLVGMMKGQAADLAELAAAGLTPALPQRYYDSATVIGLPKDVWTTTEVLDIFQTAAETQILAAGGSISDPGTGMQYYLPDDNVITGDVSDPAGPGGLVGQILGMGGQVDVVVTRDGSVIPDNLATDRTDQTRLIDGVSDLTHNGVLPFDTYDGSESPQTDRYELRFGQEIVFASLVLHEGDIRPSGGGWGLSSDPSTPEYKPFGGYFTDLTVEVQQDGVWVSVTDLASSEAVDLVDLEYFQTIELTFDEIEGQSIRVVGSAGGQRPYTSLTELEAYGVIVAAMLEGDTNRDGVVSAGDYATVQANFGNTGVPGIHGDASGDGVVSAGDYASVQGNFGNVASAMAPIPEPATLILLLLGIVLLLIRRRRRVD